jgi:hypothetical protein
MLSVLTWDGRIVDKESEVAKGECMDHKSREAWGIDVKNQFVAGKDRFQLVWEGDVAPIPLWSKTIKKYVTTLLTQIANETIDLNMLDLEEKSKKDSRFWMFMTVIITLCVLVGIGFLKNLWSQGKMPWQ